MKQKFRALIVWLILNGKAEKALELLAKHYGVNAPKLKVGLPKAHKKKTLGCYNAKNKTISVLNSDTLKEPFIILHEFYHHLRTALDAKHRGRKGTQMNSQENSSKHTSQWQLGFREMIDRRGKVLCVCVQRC